MLKFYLAFSNISSQWGVIQISLVALPGHYTDIIHPIELLMLPQACSEGASILLHLLPGVLVTTVSVCKHLMQARSHWLGWSGFNLTTYTQFMQLRFNKLISSVALRTSFV